jgi:hypothetical protein
MVGWPAEVALPSGCINLTVTVYSAEERSIGLRLRAACSPDPHPAVNVGGATATYLPYPAKRSRSASATAPPIIPSARTTNTRPSEKLSWTLLVALSCVISVTPRLSPWHDGDLSE